MSGVDLSVGRVVRTVELSGIGRLVIWSTCQLSRVVLSRLVKWSTHPTFLNFFKGPSLLNEAVDKCKSIGSSLKTVELNELAMDTTSSYYVGYWTGSRRFNK